MERVSVREKVTNGGVQVNDIIPNLESDRPLKCDRSFTLAVPEAIDPPPASQLTCHDSANYRLTGATRNP